MSEGRPPPPASFVRQRTVSFMQNPTTINSQLDGHEDLTDTSSSEQSVDIEKRRPGPTPLRRADSQYDRVFQRTQSVLSAVRSRPQQFGGFTHPYAHEKTDEKYLVNFDGDNDPHRPQNWPMKKKVITTFLYSLTAMGSTLASSIYSPGAGSIREQFGASDVVSRLGTALLLFGFATGPLLWAPLSELYGRKPTVLLPYTIAAIFAFACGASDRIQAILITRFFLGFFASAPVTNTGGVMGDLFTAEQRGVAMVGYAIAVLGGVPLGPIIGGAFVETQGTRGWRWTQYITGLFMLAVLTLDVIFIDETYPPKILVAKATRLRFQSGNYALHAKHEEWEPTLKELGNKYLVRPWQILFTPICSLVCIYACFVYGILYSTLGAFPYVYQEQRGMNKLTGALPFLALFGGILLGAFALLANQSYYFQKFKQNGDRAVPEARLPPMMFGSIIFAAGMFLFAWTASPPTPIGASIIGAILIGIGFFTIFQPALNYLVDTFHPYSASCVASLTFSRSLMAGFFPLFIASFLDRLGVNWGMTVWAVFGTAMIPVPFLFFFFGKRIRAKGKWSRQSL
ncbi:putative mfs multidrug [Venturia nashicola]|uniref:Putative mfs multidrug n=1 Tax=Venturia nashicola TaxID=86259 RepID=A0A4Z1PAI6_9PEZI|nr:putative mfs multidrug [Venturia nashicola]TLD38353.1 putative mfs multidrug [Venturia nashicola]